MKKGMAMLLAAVVLLTVSAAAVDVTAEAALLMEKETGEILFAKNEHEQMEPASITKVMTLLLVMEAIDSGRLQYDDTVTGRPTPAPWAAARSG